MHNLCTVSLYNGHPSLEICTQHNAVYHKKQRSYTEQSKVIKTSKGEVKYINTPWRTAELTLQLVCQMFFLVILTLKTTLGDPIDISWLGLLNNPLM